MIHKMSLEEFIELAKGANRVAVFREVLIDRLTPISIAEALKSEMLGGAMLESGLHQKDKGRYTFIAFDSMAHLYAQGGVVFQSVNNEVSTHYEAPFEVLRNLIQKMGYVSKPQVMDLIGNIIGYVGYDAVRFFEDIPDRHVNNSQFPDMFFNFYRTVIVLDHFENKLLISLMVEIGENPVKDYHEAQLKLAKIYNHINRALQNNVERLEKNKKDTATSVDVSDEQYVELVGQAKKYIVKGDAFQIVLSRCFKKKFSVEPFEVYRALRRVSPSPYMFYLSVKEGVIVGASPEKFISVTNGQVAINPIAGTRRRAQEMDSQDITDELLNDKKELAEHMMLVDLARNDLGVICEPGSIKIEELSQVKHFSHVSHITSTITGQLKKEKDVLDALAAAFPAGTLSGAPKIRAMEIIDELETTRRGVYGGAICRLDYQGNLDSCIAIRMATLREGVATVRTGAGIVFDSDPISEANETRHKAQSVLDAISLAEEGLECF